MHARFMGEISQLLFPELCVGCGQGKGLLCKLCAAEWSGRPIANHIDGIQLLSASYYSHSISKIILRAKEDNDRRARLLIANSISQFVAEPMNIIPIPSRKAALRRRGFDHSYLLAQEVARLSGGIVQRILKVGRPIRDQTSVSHEERFANLSGAYSAKSGNQPTRPVVLIDDLVTTGSSMREAIRALKDAGIKPSLLISACIASHQLPNTISASAG